MPDFRELFTSEDFAAYQDVMIDVMVEWLYRTLFNRSGVEMATVREVVEFAKKILEIPGVFIDTPGDDISQRLKARIESHLAKIPASILRRELMKK